MLHLVFCCTVWTLVSIMLCWRLIAIANKAVSHLQRLHQIPCSNCAYFTGDYRLKCTVHPMMAMSETAIGCRDFSCCEQYSAVKRQGLRSLRNNCPINHNYLFARDGINHYRPKINFKD